jgi:RNA polymerase sigma-70 factor (ECF subfamily)
MMVSVTNNLIDKLLENRARFLSFVQRRVRSKELAEDILQSALTRAMERGDQIRSGDASIAWFYRLIRNAIADHYRNEATTTKILEQWAKESPASQQPDDPFETGDCQCIGRLLATLKSEYQNAIQSIDIEERTLTEFADLSRISANNAAVRVHRARKALLKLVEETCGTCAEHRCENCDCTNLAQKTSDR